MKCLLKGHVDRVFQIPRCLLSPQPSENSAPCEAELSRKKQMCDHYALRSGHFANGPNGLKGHVRVTRARGVAPSDGVHGERPPRTPRLQRAAPLKPSPAAAD